MFQFITRRPLWANILFAIVLFFVLLFIFFQSLDWITHHGKKLVIPSVIGKNITEAKKQLGTEGFDVVIQDSVYNDTLPPLAVVKQFPDADAEVKINRTVYLTINRAVPPTIQMPQLIGQTLRSALIILKQAGLKMGDTSFVPDFAKNSVLKQNYKGQEIVFGTKIPMGAAIDLVIGSGIADVDMAVPDLIGLTYGEAKILMEGNNLQFGAKPFDKEVKDSNNSFIYWQTPTRYSEDHQINRIHPGQTIDVRMGVQKPVRDTSNTTPNTPTNNY